MSRRYRMMPLLLLLGLAATAVAEAPTAPAQDTAATPTETKEDGDAKARAWFTDLPVVTQNGETLRFYSDVLKDQVVLISFIFTNCPDACPLITNKMLQARTMLGEGIREKVRFISLSVDTDRDTPEAMKKFAQEQGADFPNWYFLTGEKKNLQTIIRKLGQYTDTVESHSTILITGNVPEHRWAKIMPMVQPAGVAFRVSEIAGALSNYTPGG